MPATMEDETPRQEPERVLDIRQIMAILPHRYPFLLIDRVIESSPRRRIVAIKNVTINEHFFQGHFPEYAIMPGVLVVEAIAQAGGVLLLPEVPDYQNKLMVFSGIDRARFRRPVVPGDQLRIEIDVLNWKPRAARLEGKVYVGKKLVCEATILCQVVPRPGRPAAAGETPGGGAPAESVDDRSLEAVSHE
ncbi:MAG: 3-hydroxyacyl-ACP dehydratase FabZ [Acidobacteriaceae bacterium]